MGYPIVRYAVFSVLMMVAGYFLLQSAPKDSQVKLQKVVAAVFTPRPAPTTHGSAIGDEIIVPLKWEGVWVADVEINDLYEIKLIVDTGASWTAVSSQVAFDIGLSPNSRQGKVTMSTANGLSEAWVGQIQSIRLGEAERKNVRVVVMENFGEDGIGGLLGLNFLNGFNWQIDQQAGHLILRPKS